MNGEATVGVGMVKANIIVCLWILPMQKPLRKLVMDNLSSDLASVCVPVPVWAWAFYESPTNVSHAI